MAVLEISGMVSTNKENTVSGDTADIDISHISLLKRKYEGHQVAVYCMNGARYTGTVKFFPRWLEVTKDGKQAAACNLEHVIAIAKI